MTKEKKKTKYSVPIKNHLSLLQETWDRAYQEGYAKGRVRCLEQHRGEELNEVARKGESWRKGYQQGYDESIAKFYQSLKSKL